MLLSIVLSLIEIFVHRNDITVDIVCFASLNNIECKWPVRFSALDDANGSHYENDHDKCDDNDDKNTFRHFAGSRLLL